MVFGGTLDIGLAFLLAMALAQYAKFKAEKGFTWLGVSAVFFLFSGVFMTEYFGPGQMLNSIYIVKQIFDLIGWVFALVAALFVAYETLLEK